MLVHGHAHRRSVVSAWTGRAVAPGHGVTVLARRSTVRLTDLPTWSGDDLHAHRVTDVGGGQRVGVARRVEHRGYIRLAIRFAFERLAQIEDEPFLRIIRFKHVEHALANDRALNSVAARTQT